MSTSAPLSAYIQPGEAVLVRSVKSFADRVLESKDLFSSNADVVTVSASKLLADDIRDWASGLRKSSVRGIPYGDNGMVSKLGILIFDEMLIPAQNILLKELEDLPPDNCIILSVHEHTVLLPTVLSRVVSTLTLGIENTDRPVVSDIFPDAAYFKNEKNVTRRMERMKKVVEAYDDEKISKQDIVVWIESLAKGGSQPELFSQVIMLLKQPSTLVKYVLEFFVGNHDILMK